MKKLIVLLMALLMCLSLCACNEEAKYELIENAKMLLTGGIAQDELSYMADPVDAVILQKTQDLLLAYKGDFDEKSALLSKIEQILPYVDSTWEAVDGTDTTIFESDAKDYFFRVTYNRDKESFYIRVHPIRNGKANSVSGRVFYSKDCGDNVFEYYWNGTNEAYEGYLTEAGTLRFVQYAKPALGTRTDVIVKAGELKRAN